MSPGPERCVHIGDRESDIYELFCMAQELGTHFLVRTCVDRPAGNGDYTIPDEMAEVAIKGLHRVDVRDKRSNGRQLEGVALLHGSAVGAVESAGIGGQALFCPGSRHAIQVMVGVTILFLTVILLRVCGIIR
jgi:hypothetical protein